MKNRLIAASILCLALASTTLHADVLYWSGNGIALGGGGTWNTTSGRWGTSSSGPFTNLWSNTISNDATLAVGDGTTGGGSVVLGAGITMKGTLTWQSTPGSWPNYSINGASVLTFSPGSALNCNNTGGNGGMAVGSLNAPYAGTITKTGTGQVAFNNANGNVTKFILNAGTADFAAASRLAAGTDVPDYITFNGGKLRGSTVVWGSFGKSITIGASGGTIFGSSSSVTMTADKPITSTGSGRLTITSAQFTLSNTSNNWAGPMTINGTGCKVTLGASGVIPDACILTLNATLNLNSKNETIGTLSDTTGTGLVTLGSGTLTLSDGRNSFLGIISGTGGLVKQGTGVQILSGNNTYSGATTVSAGTLVFSGLSTCTGVTTVSSNAALRIATNSLALPNSPVALNSGAALDVADQDVTITALSGSGVVSNNAGLAGNHTLTVNGNLSAGQVYNQYSCYSGAITKGSLIKDGTHAMALRGSNTFDGGTISYNPSVAPGTISVGAAPDRIPATTALGVPPGALFQLDASRQTVASLTGNGSVNLGGGVLTINENVGNTFSGIIQDSELTNSPTGLGHGLRGYYYTNIDLTVLGAVRDDATVNIPNMNYWPFPAKTNQVSARWLGQVLTTAAGDYKFTTTCDDGSRLWVNGALVVDNWVPQGATPKSGTITLAANARYDLVMEYFNNTVGGAALLSWMPPGDTTTNVIPTEYLFLPGPGALVMGGTGTLTLDKANTYSGNTIVAAGQLNAQADGALGNGNVTVSNANLVLQWAATNGYMNPSANLLLQGTAKVSLNFNGSEDIRGLSFDGVYQPAGTYGSSSSTATYKDDARFDATYSGILNVTAGATANALTASASPTVYGTPVALTSTVTPPGATGTVTFYDGTTWLGSAPLDGSGVATLTVNNLSVTASPHSITSVYGGDAAHAPSTSGAVSQSTTAAPLTPSVVVSKVYDATTNATINSVSFSGILSLDTNYVSFAGTAVANFRDKDVGTGKPVDITGLALAGSLSGNYTMATTAMTATGSITNKTLTVSGLTATNRVYDASLNENTTGSAVLNGVISPEVVNLDGTPVLNFLTKTVGTAKPVAVSGLSISGADSANYILVLTNLSANITAFPISVGAITANSKVYDATTNATLSGTATISPAPFAGDDVTLGGTPVAGFSTKTAGTGKAVTVKGYTISGTDAANYTLSQPAGLTANITAVPTTCLLVSSMNPSTITSNVTFTATITANPLPLANDAPTGTVAFSTNGVTVANVIVVSNSPGVATAFWSTAALPVGITPVLAAYLTDTNYQACNMSVQQTVNNGSICSQTNRIDSIVNNGDGTITLNFVGTPEAEYYVITQANAAAPLATWTTLGSTNKAPVGGLWSVTVTNDSLRQFYRAAAVNACP